MQILPKNSAAAIVFTDLRGELSTSTARTHVPEDSVGSLHRHDCAEFGLCLSGSGVFHIGDRVVPFAKGTVTYFPPFLPHIAHTPPGVSSDWIFLFANTACFGCVSPPDEGVLTDNPDSFALLNMLVRAVDTHARGDGYYHALLDAFFLSLNRPAPTATDDSACFYKIAPAIRYMEEQYMDTAIEVAQLAKMCSMSSSQFARFFHVALGSSPIAHLHSLRIRAAEGLLLSSKLSVTEIAFQVGYMSPSSFYRQFIQKHHISPRAFREMCDCSCSATVRQVE